MDVEQLRGRAVVSVQQAEKIGTVHDVLVDTSAHRLAGLVLQGGLFRGGPSIAWADVRTIGQDAVMVDDRRAAANATVDGAVKLADLRGRKVVTDSGELAEPSTVWTSIRRPAPSPTTSWPARAAACSAPRRATSCRPRPSPQSATA